jgi:hypothetical protein
VDLQAVVAIFPRKVTGGRIVSILVETVTTLARVLELEESRIEVGRG